MEKSRGGQQRQQHAQRAVQPQARRQEPAHSSAQQMNTG
jgi:hypothetical protein